MDYVKTFTNLFETFIMEKMCTPIEVVAVPACEYDNGIMTAVLSLESAGYIVAGSFLATLGIKYLTSKKAKKTITEPEIAAAFSQTQCVDIIDDQAYNNVMKSIITTEKLFEGIFGDIATDTAIQSLKGYADDSDHSEHDFTPYHDNDKEDSCSKSSEFDSEEVDSDLERDFTLYHDNDKKNNDSQLSGFDTDEVVKVYHYNKRY